MDVSGHDVIFDMSTQPFDWSFVYLSAAFALIGAIMLCLRDVLPARVVGSLILVFALGWGVFAFAIQWGQYKRLQDLYTRGAYRVVEGRVENFRDDPSGKGPQRFDVSGIRLEFGAVKRQPRLLVGLI